MRWLTNDVYYARAESGGYLLGYGGLLRLDTDVPADVVDQVMASLSSGLSVEAALGQVTSAQKAQGDALVNALRLRGLLADGRSTAPLRVPAGAVAREMRAVVVGSGSLADALAAACAESGLRWVHRRAPGGPSHPVGADDVVIEVGQGATLQCDDGPTGANGAAPVPRWRVAEDASGVFWASGETGSKVRSASRRAAALRGAASAEKSGPRISDAAFTALAAKQIAHDVLAQIHGSRSRGGAVRVVDRRTLRTGEHRIAVHPFDRPASQVPEAEFFQRLSVLRDGASLTGEYVDEVWRELGDRRFGAVTGLEVGFEQIPLRVSAACVSDPCGLLGDASAVTVVAAGPDGVEARMQARLNALAAYGGLVADPRLMVDRDGAFLGRADSDPAVLLEAVSASPASVFVRAMDLASGRTRLLRADRAYPVLRTSLPQTYRVPCGTSAAPSWDAALTGALLQHCLRLTVAGPLRSSHRPARLTAADFTPDPAVEYCRVMLDAAGLDVVLQDVTGPLRVPVVSGTAAAVGTVYGCGTDLPQAVREALLALLLRYQARSDSCLAAAIACSSVLPLLASDFESARSASQSADKLTAALGAAGRSPAVFALDQDPTLRRVMPFTLRVVLEEAADA